MDIPRLKQHEDEVLSVLERWPAVKRAIAYKWLYSLGLRVGDVERVIREELLKEARRDP